MLLLDEKNRCFNGIFPPVIPVFSYFEKLWLLPAGSNMNNTLLDENALRERNPEKKSKKNNYVKKKTEKRPSPVRITFFSKRPSPVRTY